MDAAGGALHYPRCAAIPAAEEEPMNTLRTIATWGAIVGGEAIFVAAILGYRLLTVSTLP